MVSFFSHVQHIMYLIHTILLHYLQNMLLKKSACLICLVVSHSEGERLRQVARGQLGSIIIWRSTARCTVVGNWDLGKRIYLYLKYVYKSVFQIHSKSNVCTMRAEMLVIKYVYIRHGLNVCRTD